ncbi:MAG TPA: fused MFS/spermidine synthase [Gemmatimonadaceae bacterium]|nr:fused MFS/spermidine synthase [Gemmatimonadaceae bacterium]
MTAQPTSAAGAPARPFLPFLVLLFVGSGCAALIYEVVWLQMLSLIVGSSAISIAVVLGTFMGGMCAGSLLLSRYVSRAEHPLRVYAKLEALIAVCGFVLVFILPYVGGLYISIGVGGLPGLFLSGLFCALVLLPPTLMMGATLPAISRFVETTPQGVSWLGFFYGGNIAGGVLGALAAGYWLLRLYDVYTATFVAMLLNLAVAGIAWVLANRMPYAGKAPAPDAPKPKIFDMPKGAGPVYTVIALSGFTALGSEVIWTRLLSLNLGATTYTFSLILATFLIGLGIGSSVGAVIAGGVQNARTALGWCQILVVCSLAWAAYSLTVALPNWPVDPTLSAGPMYTFQMDFVKAAFTVIPGAICWGASFPLALAAIGTQDSDPGVVVGTTYAANTVGAILGSVLSGLVMLPWRGTQQTQQLFIVVAAISAIMMLVIWRKRGIGVAAMTPAAMAMLLLTLGGTYVLAAGVNKVPPILVGYGRFAARRYNDHGDFIFTGEGMNSSMTVSQLGNGVLNYHNAGKVQASSEPQDMRLQRMLGHMATLLPAQAPKSVLVIGCGAGVTAGSVSIDPRLEREVIAEIEPLVPSVVSTYFAEHNFNVIANPKVKVQIDDARHYLQTTGETFDAITSDPFDPWVKGAASLYTKEFFQLIKDKLNAGGVVTVFVQLYESHPAAVKSEVATFLEVFPEGLIFGNTHYGAGYDVVLVGQKTPGPIDVDAIQARLETPEYGPVAFSLSQIGFNSAVDLLSTYAARKDQLADYLSDAQLNLDKNLRLQYLAGFGLNYYEQAAIYSDMIRARQFPEGLFKGSPEKIAELRARIQ